MTDINNDIAALISQYQPNDPSARLVQLISTAGNGGTILSCLFLGSLIPVIINFILFSTKATRSKPMFWVQSTMLASAFGDSILYLIQSAELIQTFIIFTDINRYDALNIGHTIMRSIITILADTTLVLKVLAFYPTSLYSCWYRLFVISPSIVLKVARIGVIIGSIVVLTRSAIISDQYVYLLSLNVLEIIDNCFLSGMLLLQSHRLYLKRSKFNSNTSKARLQYLVESIFLTFVPAILVQFVSLGLMCSAPIKATGSARKDFSSLRGKDGLEKEAYIALLNAKELNEIFFNPAYFAWLVTTQLNLIVSVHFSLLATTWTTLRETKSATPSIVSSEEKSSDEGGAPIRVPAVSSPLSLTRRSRNIARSHQSNNAQERTLLSYIADSDEEPIEVLDSLPGKEDDGEDKGLSRGNMQLRLPLQKPYT